MDTATLRQIDEWLAELEREATMRVGQQYNPTITKPEETAHLAGQALGIGHARAWVQAQAKKHRPAE